MAVGVARVVALGEQDPSCSTISASVEVSSKTSSTLDVAPESRCTRDPGEVDLVALGEVDGRALARPE